MFYVLWTIRSGEAPTRLPFSYKCLCKKNHALFFKLSTRIFYPNTLCIICKVQTTFWVWTTVFDRNVTISILQKLQFAIAIFEEEKTRLATTDTQYATIQVLVPSSCEIQSRRSSSGTWVCKVGAAAFWQIRLIPNTRILLANTLVVAYQMHLISHTPNASGKYIWWPPDKYTLYIPTFLYIHLAIYVHFYWFSFVSLFTGVYLLLLQYPCIGPHPFHTLPHPPTQLVQKMQKQFVFFLMILMALCIYW